MSWNQGSFATAAYGRSPNDTPKSVLPLRLAADAATAHSSGRDPYLISAHARWRLHPLQPLLLPCGQGSEAFPSYGYVSAPLCCLAPLGILQRQSPPLVCDLLWGFQKALSLTRINYIVTRWTISLMDNRYGLLVTKAFSLCSSALNLLSPPQSEVLSQVFGNFAL